jgi:hypothetical protein
MTREEAEEFFEFYLGVWMGDRTPCFMEAL